MPWARGPANFNLLALCRHYISPFLPPGPPVRVPGSTAALHSVLPSPVCTLLAISDAVEVGILVQEALASGPTYAQCSGPSLTWVTKAAYEELIGLFVLRVAMGHTMGKAEKMKSQ